MSTLVHLRRAMSGLRSCWSTPRRAAAASSISGAILAAGVIALVQVPAAGAAVHSAKAPAKGTIISVSNIPLPKNIVSGAVQPERPVPSNTGYRFVSPFVTKTISAKSTKVVITGTIDLGSSVIQELASGYLSVCAQRGPSGTLHSSGRVEPEIYTGVLNEFFAQSASGVLANLSPGKYRFGLCIASRSANLETGFSSGTVMLIAGYEQLVRSVNRDHERAAPAWAPAW